MQVLLTSFVFLILGAFSTAQSADLQCVITTVFEGYAACIASIGSPDYYNCVCQTILEHPGTYATVVNEACGCTALDESVPYAQQICGEFGYGVQPGIESAIQNDTPCGSGASSPGAPQSVASSTILPLPASPIMSSASSSVAAKQSQATPATHRGGTNAPHTASSSPSSPSSPRPTTNAASAAIAPSSANIAAAMTTTSMNAGGSSGTDRMYAFGRVVGIWGVPAAFAIVW